MAFQFPKPATAFSQQPTGKKSGRIEDKPYLEWIRSLPCVITGTYPVEAAHISFAEPKYGKLGRGKGTKEDDKWAIPMAHASHMRSHDLGERRYWEMIGIDPCIIAMALYAAYPDEEKARLILEHSRNQARQSQSKRQ
jgi:hypothetical protein